MHLQESTCGYGFYQHSISHFYNDVPFKHLALVAFILNNIVFICFTTLPALKYEAKTIKKCEISG